MLNDDFLQRLFTNEEMQLIPIGFQATAVRVFETELSKLKEKNENATLSDILSNTVPTEFTESNTEFAESTGSISNYVESTEYEPSANYDY